MQGDNPNPAQPVTPAAEPTQPTMPVAEPIQPAQPETSAPTVVATPVDNSGATPLVQGGKSNKGLIIGIICGVIAVVLIVCCVIFIPMIFAIDYKDAYDKIESAHDEMSKINSGDCYSMASGVSYTSKSEDDYKDMAKSCNEQIKKFEEAFDEFGKTAAANKDDEVKEKFAKAKENYDAAKDALADLPDFTSAIHAFYLRANKLTSGKYRVKDLAKISDSDIDKVAQPLIDSRFDELKKFGEEFKKQAKIYYKSVRELAKAEEDYNNDKIEYKEYSKAYTAYNDARKKYMEYSGDIDEDKLMERYSDEKFDDKLEAAYDALDDIDDYLFKKYLDQE